MSDTQIIQKKPPDPEFLAITNDVWVAIYFFENSTCPMVNYNQDKNELLKMMRNWNGIDRKRGALIYKLEAPE